MSFKELAVPVYLKDGKALQRPEGGMLAGGEDVAALAVDYSNYGADAIILYDFSNGDAEHDMALHRIKEMAQAVDIPVFGGGNIKRMEDVKKLIYAGCQKVFLNYAKESNIELTHEVSGKFGKEKIMASVRCKEALIEAFSHAQLLGGILLPYALADAAYQGASERGLSGTDFYRKHSGWLEWRCCSTGKSTCSGSLHRNLRGCFSEEGL